MVACAQPAAAGEVKSDKPRITSPDISPADEALLVEGNSAFALDLYQALSKFAIYFIPVLTLG